MFQLLPLQTVIAFEFRIRSEAKRKRQLIVCTVLRSRNYLFSAPAPAPPPAINCHLKLLYNSIVYPQSIPYQERKTLAFIHPIGSSNLAKENIYFTNNFGSGSRSQNNFNSTGSGSAILGLPVLYIKSHTV